MTGIFYPFVSCLLHTKTGQHSLPPLYMISGTPPMFTQLSWWSPAIDPHYGEDGAPTNQVACRTPFIPADDSIMVRMAPWPTRLPHRTPFIHFYPMVSHIGLHEYASPTPIRHHSPFPLFHWPALNLPNTKWLPGSSLVSSQVMRLEPYPAI